MKFSDENFSYFFANFSTQFNLRVMSDQKSVPMALKFAFGGLSGAGAACVVQPMDLVKNRMQVCFHTISLIVYDLYK